jgi:hypothetical protein
MQKDSKVKSKVYTEKMYLSFRELRQNIFYHAASFEHQFHIGGIGNQLDILQHIAIHNHYVGQFACFERAQVLVQAVILPTQPWYCSSLTCSIQSTALPSSRS